MLLLDINLELWQLLLSIAGTGAVTGFVTWIFTFRNTVKKDKEKLKQEQESTENLEINNEQSRIDMIQKSANTQIENANKLIEMYKNSVEDIKAVHAEHERVLTIRFEELKEEVDKLRADYNEQKRQNEELTRKADERDATINDLKLQIEEIKKESDRDCRYCAFSEGCKKKLALESKVKKTRKDTKS